MAQSAKSRKTKRTMSPPLAVWGKRAVIALVAGLSIGAGAGVLTVQRLEPGRGTGVDSLAVMLDSIAKGRIPESAARELEAERQRRADGARSDSVHADSVRADSARADSAGGVASAETPSALVPVPSLVDLDEGTARNTLLAAGLQVGEVQFQASARPAGTVLATIPAAGQPLPPLGAVTIVLSDGRRRGADTLLPLSRTTP